MSGGMQDASACGSLYQAVWNAVYDLRCSCVGDRTVERFPHDKIVKMNELIADLGWQFQLAEYAEPVFDAKRFDAGAAWQAAADLRRALRGVNVGHRGLAPYIDRQVSGLLSGTGYELVERYETRACSEEWE